VIRIRSTTNCPNTPRVLVALEDTATPYEIAPVPDGTFTARYGIPGPELTDETTGVVVVEIGAVIRHVARAYGAGTLWPADRQAQADVDRWYELMRRLAAAAADHAARPLLERLDARLADRDWLVDTFTMADCAFVAALPMRSKLPLDGLPRLAAYLDRLAARPSVVRGLARVPR
jgi:glutathione S-transferase